MSGRWVAYLRQGAVALKDTRARVRGLRAPTAEGAGAMLMERVDRAGLPRSEFVLEGVLAEPFPSDDGDGDGLMVEGNGTSLPLEQWLALLRHARWPQLSDEAVSADDDLYRLLQGIGPEESVALGSLGVLRELARGLDHPAGAQALLARDALTRDGDEEAWTAEAAAVSVTREARGVAQRHPVLSRVGRVRFLGADNGMAHHAQRVVKCPVCLRLARFSVTEEVSRRVARLPTVYCRLTVCALGPVAPGTVTTNRGLAWGPLPAGAERVPDAVAVSLAGRDLPGRRPRDVGQPLPAVVRETAPAYTLGALWRRRLAEQAVEESLRRDGLPELDELEVVRLARCVDPSLRVPLHLPALRAALGRGLCEIARDRPDWAERYVLHGRAAETGRGPVRRGAARGHYLLHGQLDVSLFAPSPGEPPALVLNAVEAYVDAALHGLRLAQLGHLSPEALDRRGGGRSAVAALVPPGFSGEVRGGVHRLEALAGRVRGAMRKPGFDREAFAHVARFDGAGVVPEDLVLAVQEWPELAHMLGRGADERERAETVRACFEQAMRDCTEEPVEPEREGLPSLVALPGSPGLARGCVHAMDAYARVLDPVAMKRAAEAFGRAAHSHTWANFADCAQEALSAAALERAARRDDRPVSYRVAHAELPAGPPSFTGVEVAPSMGLDQAVLKGPVCEPPLTDTRALLALLRANDPERVLAGHAARMRADRGGAGAPAGLSEVAGIETPAAAKRLLRGKADARRVTRGANVPEALVLRPLLLAWARGQGAMLVAVHREWWTQALWRDLWEALLTHGYDSDDARLVALCMCVARGKAERETVGPLARAVLLAGARECRLEDARFDAARSLSGVRPADAVLQALWLLRDCRALKGHPALSHLHRLALTDLSDKAFARYADAELEAARRLAYRAPGVARQLVAATVGGAEGVDTSGLMLRLARLGWLKAPEALRVARVVRYGFYFVLDEEGVEPPAVALPEQTPTVAGARLVMLGPQLRDSGALGRHLVRVNAEPRVRLDAARELYREDAWVPRTVGAEGPDPAAAQPPVLAAAPYGDERAGAGGGVEAQSSDEDSEAEEAESAGLLTRAEHAVAVPWGWLRGVRR